MDAVTAIIVTPMHGWGWVIAGETRFEVPDAFSVGLIDSGSNRWRGIVLDESHEFQGRPVTLAQRHTEWTGVVNIQVGTPDDGTLCTGFGMVAYLPIPASRSSSRSATAMLP